VVSREPRAEEIGEARLNDVARSEIEAARRDPRLDRGRGAAAADFWNAIEEAERVRSMSILGLHELRDVLERTEQSLGVKRTDEDLSSKHQKTLQVMWERAEMARIEIANDHPHHNAQGLIAMVSALDAMIEEFTPALRCVQSAVLAERMLGEAEKKISSELPGKAMPNEETRKKLVEAFTSVLEKRLPKGKKPKGPGLKRYEEPLEAIGLDAPKDRPIPDDMEQAVSELLAIRNVLVHRAGRVDHKALCEAPTLDYEEGEFIRITRDQYRRYSAAIACYGREVTFRSIRSWPNVNETDGPELSEWHRYYRISA